MWGISLRECTQSVHKRNKSFIKKELRLRGITLHPDSDPVARLPPGSLWTVKDVKRVFKKTLVVSYIPGQPQSYWAWMYEPDDSASILYQNSLKIRGCFPYAKAPHLSAALAPVQIAAAPRAARCCCSRPKSALQQA